MIFGWADSVHIHRWAEGLRNLGYVIKVISLDGWPVSGCDTVIFPRKGRWSYVTHASAASREAAAFSPDLVHVHYVTGFGLWAMRTRSAPMVVSVWGSDISGSKRKLLRRSLIRKTFKQATHITATSNFLKQEVVGLSQDCSDKTTVIPFGVDPLEVAPPLPLFDKLRLCSIKLHKPIYGPDVLLKAMALVRKELPNVHLSLAGRGDMTGQLKQMVCECNLGDNVDFPGFIDHKEIYSFIEKHHIVVLPSRHEAFGVAALEGSMCGRPVIASDVEGIPEVVQDNETGLLVPPDNPEELAGAIIRLSRSPETMRRMGEAGHTFAKENFTWQQSLNIMSQLYERLINEKRQP